MTAAFDDGRQRKLPHQINRRLWNLVCEWSHRNRLCSFQGAHFTDGRNGCPWIQRQCGRQQKEEEIFRRRETTSKVSLLQTCHMRDLTLAVICADPAWNNYSRWSYNISWDLSSSWSSSLAAAKEIECMHGRRVSARSNSRTPCRHVLTN